MKQTEVRIEKTCESCLKSFMARVDQTKVPGKAKYCSIACTSKKGGAAADKKYWREAKNIANKKESYRVFLNAKRRGDIKPAEICESCKILKKTNAHHDDYLRPLSVRWLCSKCHLAWHMRRV